MDTFYNDPIQFTLDLMQDIQEVTKIREQSARVLPPADADWRGQQGKPAWHAHIPANIENITLALPMQKEQGQVTL